MVSAKLLTTSLSGPCDSEQSSCLWLPSPCQSAGTVDAGHCIQLLLWIPEVELGS